MGTNHKRVPTTNPHKDCASPTYRQRNINNKNKKHNSSRSSSRPATKNPFPPFPVSPRPQIPLSNLRKQRRKQKKWKEPSLFSTGFPVLSPPPLLPRAKSSPSSTLFFLLEAGSRWLYGCLPIRDATKIVHLLKDLTNEQDYIYTFAHTLTCREACSSRAR